jgi:hypothetical protein
MVMHQGRIVLRIVFNDIVLRNNALILLPQAFIEKLLDAVRSTHQL